MASSPDADAPSDETAEHVAPSERVEPPWWTPARPGRRRQPLTREQIVDAAVAILDSEGVEALTIRRIGEALNTGSATLYWYIASKDELAELVYDRVMGEIELPDPDPEHWQDQLKELGLQVYRVMLRHNDLVRLSLGRIPVGPNALRVIDWTMGLLAAAKIPNPAASYIGDIFGRYVDASVLEVAAQGGPPPELVGQYFASLPASQFPNLAAAAGSLVEGDTHTRFEFGLDLLLRGLVSYIDSQPPA